MNRKILIILVLVVVGIGSYFIYGKYFASFSSLNSTQNSNSYSYGNSSGNLSNSGYITRFNDYLYGDLNPSGQGLYRSSLKFKNLKHLTDDQALYVNTDGQWIYYVNYSDNMHLYKVDVEGKQRIKLSSDRIDGLNLVNGILYYIDVSKKRNIYSMTIDGRDNRIITSDINCTNLIVKDGWAYYNVKDVIYRIAADGKDKIKLAVMRTSPYNSMDDWKGNFDVDNGYVYYPGTDGNLYVISAEGGKSALLAAGNVESINIYKGYAYYYGDTSKTIFRINLANKPKQEYIFGGAEYYNLNIVTNEGVLFKDKSVINGGVYMVYKNL